MNSVTHTYEDASKNTDYYLDEKLKEACYSLVECDMERIRFKFEENSWSSLVMLYFMCVMSNTGDDQSLVMVMTL